MITAGIIGTGLVLGFLANPIFYNNINSNCYN